MATRNWHDYRPPTQRPTYIASRTIPDSVTHLRIGLIEYQELKAGKAISPLELEKCACMRHPNLQQVQIYLSTVSMIGDSAFMLCPQLKQVEFVMIPPQTEGQEEQEEGDHDTMPPSQLVSIGEFAFDDCKNLKSMIGLQYADVSLKEIRDGAFQYCHSLTNADFLQSITRLQFLGHAAFQHGAFTTVDLSQAVLLTELQGYTFIQCCALVSLHLPPNLLRIRGAAFAHCSALEQIILPSKLRSIDHNVFRGCCKLKTIVLPCSLQHIGRNCFCECNKLTQVVLPSSRMRFLTTLPFNDSCKSLSSLALPNPVRCQQWPLVLEQFCREDGIARSNGGIVDPKNRNTIVWNFLCRNMAQLFIEDNSAMSRRRQAPQSTKATVREARQNANAKTCDH